MIVSMWKSFLRAWQWETEKSDKQSGFFDGKVTSIDFAAFDGLKRILWSLTSQNEMRNWGKI